MRARVVLPHPGGPHKRKEKSSRLSIATRRGFPGPTKCDCPTNSSSFCGLICDASGSIYIVYIPALLLKQAPGQAFHTFSTDLYSCAPLPRGYCTVYEYEYKGHYRRRHRRRFYYWRDVLYV